MSRNGVSGIVVVFVFLLTALAGCLGGDDVETTSDTEEGADATTTTTTGAIEGNVASDLFEPLAALVLLYDGGRDEVLRETNAQKNGEFAFGEIEPGEYVVQARHPGYQSGLRKAQVQAGEVAEVEFRLELLPTDDPYFIEDEIRGLVTTYGYCVSPAGETIACGGGFVNFVPWENARGTLEKWVDNETRTILVEMEWSPAGVLGEHLRITVACDEAGSSNHPCYFREHGTSPNIIRVDHEHAVENDYDMDQTWSWSTGPGYGMLGTYPLIGVDVGASYEQTYTIYLTFAQREAAPDGYTRLGDD